MKQFDKAFMELYDKFELDLDTPAFTGEEAVRCHEMVLDRVEVPKHNARRSTRLLLVAAVMACMVLAVAAAYYSVSDAFRGVFVEQDSTGEKVPITSTAPLIDRSGKLLESTVSSGGLDVTLRAVVGDESEIKLLVDVEDPSGKPLAITQPDGSLSTDDIRFDQAIINMKNHPDGHEGFVDERGHRYGNVGVGWGSEMIDNDPTDNKTTILFTFSIDENIHDQQFTLTLVDLMQFAELGGTSTGVDGATMSNLVTEFAGTHTEDDFEVHGWYHNHETDVTTYNYTLLTDSGKALPLGDAKGLQVTNAALWNGNLYLRGTADSYKLFQSVLRGSSLVNEATGESRRVNGTGFDLDDDGVLVWSLDFEDVTLEDLPNYTLMADYGPGMYPLAEGEWEFQFTLDYENTTRTQSLNRKFHWFGAQLSAKRIAVSPFGLSLDFSGDRAARDILSPERDWETYQAGSEWEDSPKTIILTMRDGSTIEASDPGYSISWSEDGHGEYQINYSFEVVINPEDLASVQVGDMTVSFENAGE